VRVSLALIILVTNTVAIVSILGARTGRIRKAGWLAAVVLLPLAGALGWAATGRRRLRGRGRGRHSKRMRARNDR
jgi:hypothetical protein